MDPCTQNDRQRLFITSQHGLLTRKQALAAGMSTDAIRGRLRSGVWEHVHQGVYRLAGAPVSKWQPVMAACLAGGAGAVASHRTAAGLWGLPVTVAGTEITVLRSRRVRLPGVVVHQTACLERVDVVWRHRIPVTSAARTLVDLAAVVPRDRLEPALDHVLAERQVSPGYLQWRLKTLGTRGRPGVAALLDLVARRLGEPPPSRSDFERRLGRILAGAGLPPAEAEYPVSLPGGRGARIDFAFPDALLAVEADSYRHHSSLSDWSRDRARNNELVALGWRILPITYRDMKTRPAAVADQIARALDAQVGPTWGGP
jgi:hypothetical protein